MQSFLSAQRWVRMAAVGGASALMLTLGLAFYGFRDVASADQQGQVTAPRPNRMTLVREIGGAARFPTPHGVVTALPSPTAVPTTAPPTVEPTNPAEPAAADAGTQEARPTSGSAAPQRLRPSAPLPPDVPAAPPPVMARPAVAPTLPPSFRPR
jgi:hypothetical protein